MKLARAMTIKCALAGLDAGGGKAVVLDHEHLQRPLAFQRLGERIEELGGIFRTAGDLGTTSDDLHNLARKTQYVHINEADLSGAVAQGVMVAMQACAHLHGHSGIHGLRIAVQGCGAIGSAVARRLTAAGARVIIADIDSERATQFAGAVDAELASPEQILTLDVDIVAPCAIGGVLTQDIAVDIRAWAVCGAANNILGDDRAEQILTRRDILFVPDVVASAGAVIEGVGVSVMKLADRAPLIERIHTTTRTVLEKALAENRLPSEVAEAMAWERIQSAKQ